jgi:type II secretory ATPase GspE/PulE/Tfp pilus assembly ATPase PilB-like protein
LIDTLVRELERAGELTADQAHVIMRELECGGAVPMPKTASRKAGAGVEPRVSVPRTHRFLEQICLESGFVTYDRLCAFLARAGRVPFVHLSHMSVQRAAVQRLPKDMCDALCVIAFNETHNALSVAMKDPSDIRARDIIQAHAQGTEIHFFQCAETDICSALATFGVSDVVWADMAGALTERVTGEAEDRAKNRVSEKPKRTAGPDVFVSHATHGDQEPAVQFVHALVEHSVQAGLSDIHFQPGPFFVDVRVRQDGVLRRLCVFHKSAWSQVCARIKVLSSLDITESRRPQQGRFSGYFAGRDVDIRAATHPTLEGEACTLRVLDKNRAWRHITKLGLPKELVAQLCESMQHTQGLIIVTGPTGSGKTTTLHALLATIDRAQLNVMTLEEPVEYRAPDLRQSEVNEALGFDFESGIASALRQDVDVLLIGEIRTREAAHMALRAAMTGHLVLTTMHTPYALAAVDRLLEFGVPEHQVLGYVRGIISQRLVRQTCRACTLGQARADSQEPGHGTACQVCSGTGFHGRVAIGEYVDVRQTVGLCRRDANGFFVGYSPDDGMRGLWHAGHALLEKGGTTLEELSRVLGPQPARKRGANLSVTRVAGHGVSCDHSLSATCALERDARNTEAITTDTEARRASE